MFRRRTALLALVVCALLAFGKAVHGGTATSIAGLYFTGVDNAGTALADAGTDTHWAVSYARVNGTGSTSSAYTGASRVVGGSFIDGAWVPNSSTYRWITAPGASTAATGGTTNAGGDFLPGNGTSGANSAYYIYRLAFTIGGTGTGTITNQISITLTIAADDQYAVYVNPASGPTVANNGTINAGGTAASGSGFGAWNNTTALALQNYGAGANANFAIGQNFIYIVVANTNSRTGNDPSTALNPSGLLVYQVGSATLIDGNPVPEVGTWLPVAAALGFFGWHRRRRARES